MLLMLLMLLMLGCAFQPNPPSQEEQAAKLAAALEDAAYQPVNDFKIQSVDDVWQYGQVEIMVNMTVPTEAGKYPLIVYLPGLGEDAKSGRLWRENWAKAGYAVFSIQLKPIAQAFNDLDLYTNNQADDEAEKDKIDSSRRLRNGDLRYLGHEYFAVDALKTRMQQLFWGFHQLQTKADLHQSLYSTVDFSKVILAN